MLATSAACLTLFAGCTSTSVDVYDNYDWLILSKQDVIDAGLPVNVEAAETTWHLISDRALRAVHGAQTDDKTTPDTKYKDATDTGANPAI